ncbi:MAG: transketolase family protein [Planctomycetaceae bacterium]|nr:transketolase family protein [Planctomycetaceae bacterium]
MFNVEDKIAPERVEMRTTFATTMDALATEDKRVVYLDCDLMNSIGMVGFSKKFPEQTVNCGIQEANMVGVAAGMSATGLVPYAHTFGTFASRRVMDQVFVSAAYAKLNVRIIGSDPGVTASANGGTHMPLEDMGMMRCVPEVTILEPTDSAMLADILRQTKDAYGVFYIRLSRKVADKIFTDGSTFEIGKAAQLRDGTDVTIFASGICVADALKAADILATRGIKAAVSNMFTIKPIDREAVVEAARKTGAIVTAENHSIIGGLGSAVSEVLTDTVPAPLERVGVKDHFGEVGSVDYLKKAFSIGVEDIVAASEKAMARKGAVK